MKRHLALDPYQVFRMRSVAHSPHVLDLSRKLRTKSAKGATRLVQPWIPYQNRQLLRREQALGDKSDLWSKNPQFQRVAERILDPNIKPEELGTGCPDPVPGLYYGIGENVIAVPYNNAQMKDRETANDHIAILDCGECDTCLAKVNRPIGTLAQFHFGYMPERYMVTFTTAPIAEGAPFPYTLLELKQLATSATANRRQQLQRRAKKAGTKYIRPVIFDGIDVGAKTGSPHVHRIWGGSLQSLYEFLFDHPHVAHSDGQIQDMRPHGQPDILVYGSDFWPFGFIHIQAIEDNGGLSYVSTYQLSAKLAASSPDPEYQQLRKILAHRGEELPKNTAVFPREPSLGALGLAMAVEEQFDRLVKAYFDGDKLYIQRPEWAGDPYMAQHEKRYKPVRNLSYQARVKLCHYFNECCRLEGLNIVTTSSDWGQTPLQGYDPRPARMLGQPHPKEFILGSLQQIAGTL